MVIMTSKSQNAQQCQGGTHLLFDVGHLMPFMQKPLLPQIFRGCQDIPYRTKKCRTKVTKFFESDENFVRRNILSDEKFCPNQKFQFSPFALLKNREEVYQNKKNCKTSLHDFIYPYFVSLIIIIVYRLAGEK